MNPYCEHIPNMMASMQMSSTSKRRRRFTTASESTAGVSAGLGSGGMAGFMDFIGEYVCSVERFSLRKYLFQKLRGASHRIRADT
jgi:hypothetical protein